jgi:hypothetical protein
LRNYSQSFNDDKHPKKKRTANELKDSEYNDYVLETISGVDGLPPKQKQTYNNPGKNVSFSDLDNTSFLHHDLQLAPTKITGQTLSRINSPEEQRKKKKIITF